MTNGQDRTAPPRPPEAGFGAAIADLRDRPNWRKWVWIGLGTVWLLFNIVDFFRHMDWWVIYEQMSSGMLATGLVDGLAAPFQYYQYYHTTGTVVFGLLLFPAYAIAGPSFAWIKIASFLFVAGGVFFWTSALRRGWGGPTAIIFLLMLIFPPPFVDSQFHQAWANHSEGLFFSGLLLFLFVRLDDRVPTFNESLALGAVAGFGCYFCLDNLVMSLAIAAAIVLRWRRPGVRRLVWPTSVVFVLSFLPVFFAPRLPAHADNHALVAAKSSALEVGGRFADLFVRVLPRCAGFEGRIGPWLSLVWCVIALLGAAFGLRRNLPLAPRGAAARWLSIVLFFHFVFFVIANGLSKLHVEVASSRPDLLWNWRYLTAIILTLLAFVAYFLRQWRAPWPWLLALPFLAAGYWNTVARIHWSWASQVDGFRAADARRGDDYLWFMVESMPAAWKGRSDALASIGRLPRRWRGQGYIVYGANGEWGQVLDAVADGALPEDIRQNIGIGAGWAFLQSASPKPDAIAGFREEKKTYVPRLHGLNETVARSFVEGIGTALQGLETTGLQIAEYGRYLRDLLPQVNDGEFASAIARGVGEQLGILFNVFDEEKIFQDFTRYGRAFAVEFGANARNSFWEGVAEGRAKIIANNWRRVKFDPRERNLPAIRQALARMGVELRPWARDPRFFELEIQN